MNRKFSGILFSFLLLSGFTALLPEGLNSVPAKNGAGGKWTLTAIWMSKSVDWGNCKIVPRVDIDLSKNLALTAHSPGECRGADVRFKHTWQEPPKELKTGQTVALELGVEDAGTVWSAGSGRGYTAVFLGNYTEKPAVSLVDVHIPGMMDYACKEKDSGPLWEGKSFVFQATRGDVQKKWSHEIEKKIPVEAAFKSAAFLCKGQGKRASKSVSFTVPATGAKKKFLVIVVAGHGSRVSFDSGSSSFGSEGTAGAHGTVYYEYSYGESNSISGFIKGKLDEPRSPIHPSDFPLSGVVVSLRKNGKEIAKTVSRADGSYSLDITEPAESVSLRVELEYAGRKPYPFRVVQDDSEQPIGAETKPFSVSPGQSAPFVKDIVFGPGTDLIPLQTHPSRLVDAALIYRYTQMAFQFIDKELLTSVPELAFDPPLTVRAFSTSSMALEQGAYGDMGKPDLALKKELSERANELRAGTIWHELGHVVHGVMTRHHVAQYWAHYRDIHKGFQNPDTVGSYIEGFATFFAALVSSREGGLKDGVVNVNGYARNLALPENMPWSVQGELEEFAVAALLWDLCDGDENVFIHRTDQASLDKLRIAFDPPFPSDKKFERTFRDRIQISVGALFKILSEPSSIDPVPYALEGMSLWDVRQLYSVLKEKEKAETPSRAAAATPADALSPLDEVFVMHGFFGDAAPQNLIWDAKEKIGYSANGGKMWFWEEDVNAGRKPLITFKPRFKPAMRRVPPPPSTWIDCRVVDASGRSVKPRDFEIEVSYAPPYEKYGYAFRTRVAASGRLPVLCADPAIGSTTTIRPLDGRGALVPAALTLTGNDYWSAVGKTRDRVILKHDFKVASLPAGWEQGSTERPTASLPEARREPAPSKKTELEIAREELKAAYSRYTKLVTEGGEGDVEEALAAYKKALERVEELEASASTIPVKKKQASSAAPVRIGQNIPSPRKIVDAAPEYPETAKSAGVQGVVILDVIIGADGKVQDVKVVRSIPLLDEAAIDAVRKWVYEPTVIDGNAVPVIMTVTVLFSLH